MWVWLAEAMGPVLSVGRVVLLGLGGHTLLNWFGKAAGWVQGHHDVPPDREDHAMLMWGALAVAGGFFLHWIMEQRTRGRRSL